MFSIKEVIIYLYENKGLRVQYCVKILNIFADGPKSQLNFLCHKKGAKNGYIYAHVINN
jgi:hypothetical protein